MAPEQSTLDLASAPATSPAATTTPGATPADTDPLDALTDPTLASDDIPAVAEPADLDAAPDGALTPDADETPATEDAPEGTEETPETTEAAPEFDIAVPLPAAEGKRSGTLEFSFPTQEARDTVQFHVKRSLELDAVKADAEAGLTAKAALDHLEQSPETAMFQLEAFKPEAAAAYVKNWASRNPIEAAKMVLGLGFVVQDPWNDGTGNSAERALADKTALAKMQQDERMRKDRETFTQTFTQTRQQREGVAAVQAVMATVPGDPQSAQHRFLANELASLAAAHLTANPHATRADLASLPAVTQLVQSFQSLTPKAVVATPAAPPKDAKGRFRQQAQTAQTARRLAPGQSRIPALRAEKFKRGTTLDDLP